MAQGFGDLCFDGFYRDVESGGDLLVAKVFVTAEKEYLPAFFRKFGNGVINLILKIFMVKIIGLGKRDGTGNLFKVDQFLAEFAVIAQMVQAFVANGGAQVGFHLPFGIDVISFQPKADERILDDLAGNFGVFYITKGKVTEFPEVAFE